MIKKVARTLASKRKEIAALDDEFFGEIVGVAQAIAELRKALNQLSASLDRREFEKASALGYGAVPAEFVFLQRTLGGLQGAYLSKEKLVSDIAYELRCPYEEVLPHVDALMQSPHPLSDAQRKKNRKARPHGRFVVAWMDVQNQGATAPTSIYLSHYDPSSGWEAPLHVPAIDSRLDPAPLSPRRPSVAVDRDGSVVVTWSERRAAGTSTQQGTGWVRAERFTEGVGWSSPDLVSGPFPAPPGDVPCFGALDHGGHAAVLWTEGDPPTPPDAAPGLVPVHPMAATFDGTWDAPARLDSADGAQTFVDVGAIATDSNGHFMATWYDRVYVGQSLGYSIYAARLTLGGAWSSPTMLNTPPSGDGGAGAARGAAMLYMSEDGTPRPGWTGSPDEQVVPTLLTVIAVGTALRRHRLGPPPAQIPASGTTALGSCLGF